MSSEILRKSRPAKEVIAGQDLTAAKKVMGDAQLNGLFASAEKVDSAAIRVKKRK